MKNLISLFVFCFTIAASAQVINFPDANFKQKLILLGVDLNSDNEIQVSEAMQRTHLDLISYSITNISGLEYFVNLEALILQDIPISTIAPIYGLTNLKELRVSENELITSLNLTSLTSLEIMNCYELINLNSINVNGLINLKEFYCSANPLITTVNFSSLVNLEILFLNYCNNLPNLNLNGLNNLTTVRCSGSNLNSISLYGLTNLENLHVDTNNLTTLNLSGLSNLRGLYCYNNSLSIIDVRETKVDHIECQTNVLTELYINNGYTLSENSQIGNSNSLNLICSDTSELPLLSSYTCTISTSCSLLNSYIYIPDINFKNKLLQANTNNSIAKNSSGVAIKIDTNNDSEIQLSEVANVYQLNVSNAAITSLIGIKFFTNLTRLECNNNQITTLDIAGMTTINHLNFSFNQLTTINLSTNVNLQNLNCSNNQISNVNLNDLTALVVLDCSSNLLTSLNAQYCSLLTSLNCSNNQLLTLFIKNNSNETTLNFSNNVSLEYICSDATQFSQVQSLVTTYGYTNCALSSSCTIGNLIFLDPEFKNILLAADIDNTIALNAFYSAIKIDSNNDGEIQLTEALEVYSLNLFTGQNLITQSLSGIENFSNLRYLTCQMHQITALDVSNLYNLEYLNCSYNYLASLNVNGLTNLKQLYCNNNLLENNLDVTSLTNLEYFDCSSTTLNSINASGLINLQNFNCADSYNLTTINVNGLINLNTLTTTFSPLTSLDTSGLTNLEFLYCNDNELTSLNLNGLTNLKELYCDYNQLTNIDLTGLTNLQYLICNQNQLTSIDVSGLTNLIVLECSFNPQLNSINLKNGLDEGLAFEFNPNLQYICADDSQLSAIQTQITNYGYTNCHVNSYCSFTPGGTYYTIQGVNKYDGNSNGCEVADESFPNLKLSFSDGTNTGNLIANSTGNYSYNLQAGTHTITPVFENQNYFSVSPTSATVEFPSAISPFTQNFCIAPNGIHNDLEVSILPIGAASPGFDANYKLIFKNKGTSTQSGSINLVFDDALMDFVLANPLVFNQTENNLNWNFTDLQPFESRQISFTLNLNAPTETPALNGGDTISYNATISGLTDETPTDNIILLNQEVVNSFDPNDKTCLEGATITPDKVGEYVHYMIRFENTGTANAQNIVVKDMIDTTKFDIATLVPIDGSHSFVTRITNTNQVQFIFENIQLPFDNASNDGYVAFKIKTKSTLTTGSSFSNTASIYFDYNFPIVTNTATTTIQALANQDFEFSNYFELAPNPTKNVLQIQSKKDIELSSISIYNTLGQLVLMLPNAKETTSIDVSQLTTGTYFVKVISDKGSSNSKFIKE